MISLLPNFRKACERLWAQNSRRYFYRPTVLRGDGPVPSPAIEVRTYHIAPGWNVKRGRWNTAKEAMILALKATQPPHEITAEEERAERSSRFPEMTPIGAENENQGDR